MIIKSKRNLNEEELSNVIKKKDTAYKILPSAW